MIPVIISGGSGVRLWPVSRKSFPKQFCEFLEESLFAKALKRAVPLGSPWTVTTRDLRVLTERSYRELNLKKDQILFEPTGKNTAAAIALLCRVFEHKSLGGEVVGIFPADQLIDDDLAFQKAVRLAVRHAEAGEIVTLGVQPTYPATGYGYIESSSESFGDGGARKATRFCEKPDLKTAEEMLEQGGYYWNAGMFIFKVSVMIEIFQRFAPDIWQTFQQLKSDLSGLDEIYAKVRAISIDYAVMERLKSHVVVPCEFTWSDLGSWDAMAEVLGSEQTNNRKVVEVSGQGNFVFPEKGKTYALAGVSNLIVVDSPDALLIVQKGQSEKVKDVVEKLKERANSSVEQHSFDVRPWGRFDVLADRNEFKAKTIVVDAGSQISYQSHEQRAEHWIIVAGKGEVVLDDQVFTVGSGQHIFIPMHAKHRIRNTGVRPLLFVEVQLGTYFGEDDIARFQDDYDRV